MVKFFCYVIVLLWFMSSCEMVPLWWFQEGQLAVLAAMAQLASHPQLAQNCVLPHLESRFFRIGNLFGICLYLFCLFCMSICKLQRDICSGVQILGVHSNYWDPCWPFYQVNYKNWSGTDYGTLAQHVRGYILILECDYHITSECSLFRIIH